MPNLVYVEKTVPSGMSSLANERSFPAQIAISNSVSDKIYYYACTVKGLAKRPKYQSDLDNFIDQNYWEGLVSRRVYEIDSEHRLHCHFLFRSHYANFIASPRRYWHQYAEPLEDFDKYEAYCKKHARNYDEQEQILLAHSSFHNNLFDVKSDMKYA